ncbi:MAG: LCP family protein [Chloroflexi bacterium]|nr:LCP family protein [Chloroflexota bacterium]
MSRTTDMPTSRGRSTISAAFLSFLWPGLGQWYLGRRRDALLYAAPAVALAVVLGVQFVNGLTAAAARLFDPSFSLGLLVVIGILGVWRLLAIADAGFQPRRLRTLRGRAGGVLALLTALVIGMHGVAGYYTWSFYDASLKIFVGTADGPESGVNESSGPGPTDDYNVPPFATPAAPGDRITLLLTGIDKTTERDHSLTDTLLVVSVDPATGRTAMVSFPRDLAGFPMYGGGSYSGKINSLMTYAANHRSQFPDGPLPTLVKELSYLLGIPINYYAALDIDGFQTMIDAVGGVTVTIDRPINDPGYYWLDSSARGFFLSAGTHKLDGRTALAFVRTRFSDSDFARAARQQQLLVALEKKMTSPTMLGKLPAVLQAASQTIRTNFPPDRLEEMIALAERIDDSMITRVVLQPPTYSFHPPNNTTAGVYTLSLKWDAVKALSVQLFGSASAFWTAAYIPSPVPSPAP